MKTTSLLIFVMLCISCAEKNTAKTELQKESASQYIIKPEFQSILDSSDVVGSILIYDLKHDLYYSNNFEWSSRGQLPASTFKITNSIIGLETGVIEDENYTFEWDGEEKWLKSWEQDLVLKKAFQYSCVHCYQEVAWKIGPKRMNEHIGKLNYGNLVIDSTNIDNFWLQGESRISQVQQIDFLKRLYKNELPISDSTEKIMKDILLFDETDKYKLSGKSGLSIENENYNGWYVGYIELKSKTYFYATNVEPDKEVDLNTFIPKRLDVTIQALREMKIIN